MPRAEGEYPCVRHLIRGLHPNSRNAEVHRQQDEVQGTSEAAMVLPDLRETMSRRERVQDALVLRVAFAADACGGRERWEAHIGFFVAVPIGICCVVIEEVRLALS